MAKGWARQNLLSIQAAAQCISSNYPPTTWVFCSAMSLMGLCCDCCSCFLLIEIKIKYHQQLLRDNRPKTKTQQKGLKFPKSDFDVRLLLLSMDVIGVVIGVGIKGRRIQIINLQLPTDNHMRASLLNSYSSYGKYLPNDTPVQSSSSATLATISLKQNFVHERPFVQCKFDIQANRLYLLDTGGALIHVNLTDNSFSTLKSQKVKDFTIDGNNSLSLLYVNPQSELYRVSFENKKPTKIMNLNMSKILAFERNYLREMLMALDYKLLFICDLTRSGPSRIRSLKAGNQEVFTNACFASNNRYIILAIKNIEIRIVEIMNLETVHSIRLPFAVDNLKIEVSYDSKRIAVYGDCHIIFFINVQDNQFAYELIEIPFIKTIPQLKYTYQNDIVFLGNDQILYAVAPEEPSRAVPLFNQEYHVRMMGFDISLDCCQVVMVSNRTVMQLKFPKGLKQFIEKMETYKTIDYRKNGFDSVMESNRGALQHPEQIVECMEEEEENSKKGAHEENIKGPEDRQSNNRKQNPNGNYQYEDEDESEEEEAENSAIDFGTLANLNQGVPQMPLTFPNSPTHLHPYLSGLKLSGTRKQQIHFILNHVSSNYRNVCHHQAENIVDLLLRMTEKCRITAQNALLTLDCIYRGISFEVDRIDHFGVILCPQIKAIIQKRFSVDFNDYFKQNLLTVCSRFLCDQQWVNLINWLISFETLGKPESLALVLVGLLQETLHVIHQRGQEQWELLINPSLDVLGSLTFKKTILPRVSELQANERYRSLFANKKISEVVQEEKVLHLHSHGGDKLEELIVKQEEIKRALSQLQKGK